MTAKPDPLIDRAEREVITAALQWHSAIVEAPTPKDNPAWWDTKRAATELRAAVERLKAAREIVLGVRTLGVKKRRPR